MSKPMGIMASFSKVSFKKDGEELFSARVTSGGCFGPDPTLDVINRGYGALKAAVSAGTADKAALEFNTVAVGAREYSVGAHGPENIKAKDIKLITP